jgi:hypothetical protein
LLLLVGKELDELEDTRKLWRGLCGVALRLEKLGTLWK